MSSLMATTTCSSSLHSPTWRPKHLPQPTKTIRLRRKFLASGSWAELLRPFAQQKAHTDPRPDRRPSWCEERCKRNRSPTSSCRDARRSETRDGCCAILHHTIRAQPHQLLVARSLLEKFLYPH